MGQIESVVVIGAGLAGLSVVRALRATDFAGEITLIGAEPHAPYDRPPLSKKVLQGELDDTSLEDDEFYSAPGITLRTATTATALDPGARTVTLSDGEELHYDAAVVATGLAPRRLPASIPGAGLAGVHVVRTIEDARALRADLAHARTAVVVGAGFIGCEVAAVLRGRGVGVTLVDPLPTPLHAVVGDEVGALVARLHTTEGVDVRCGVAVSGLEGDERVTAVTLSDGSTVPADVVVVGIGSTPVVEWLDGSGIEVDNGVVCDATGRTSAEGVWAVGDVACWDGDRVEHWTTVGERARAVAACLTGATPADPQVPYFWSDQYDLKVQALGEIRGTDTVHVVRDDGRKFLAYYERDGRLTGVLGAGLAGPVMKSRRHIADGTPVAELLDPVG